MNNMKILQAFLKGILASREIELENFKKEMREKTRTDELDTAKLGFQYGYICALKNITVLLEKIERGEHHG